jgi:hypothetical protein
MKEQPRKNDFSVLGLGVAACAACCAGPILAVLGGIGIAGLASAWIIGGVGIVVALLAGLAYLAVRRRRSASECHAGEGSVKLIPLYDATAPIACTISAAEIPGRIEVVERLRTNLTSLERTDHGVLLHFPLRPDIEADLRQFATDEKGCCQFWGFEVLVDDHLALRWDAPPTADGVVDQIEELFLGDEPASTLAALL